MDLTIIIPTYKNRTKLLKRTFEYYSQMNFKGKILIGDSSEGYVLNDNKELSEFFNRNIKIKHIHYPLENFPHDGFISKDITNYITTNYVCFSGDDDFQLPSTLEYCVNFLENNNDYIGAHGSKIKFTIKKNNLENITIVKGQQLDVNDPFFRFRGYMRTCTSPQYHVIRKSIWQEIYKHIDQIPDIKFLASELLPCCLYYISGRVKRFDHLVQYFMEQNPDSVQNTQQDYIIRGVNSDGWGRCSTKIREIIIEKFIELGCDRNKSERVFDEEFNFRILDHLNDQFKTVYGDSFEEFSNIYYKHSQNDVLNNLLETTLNSSISTIIPSIALYLKDN
jgi:glycosyltransferase domain-containing protein